MRIIKMDGENFVQIDAFITTDGVICQDSSHTVTITIDEDSVKRIVQYYETTY